MDPSQNIPVPKANNRRGPRRVWTRAEEEALIHALKDLVVNGWRADNAFRTGYLQVLETAMNNSIPGCNIKAGIHITNKLTVWKKTYGQLCSMAVVSGFGWDDVRHMVVATDDVWNDYVKVHKEVEGMRHKEYRFYNDWKEIFGNDRATGVDSQGYADAVEELNRKEGTSKNKGKAPFVEPTYNQNEAYVNLESDGSLDGGSFTQYTQATSGAKVKVKIEKDAKKTPESRKRKSFDGTQPDPLVKLVERFVDDSKSGMGDFKSSFKIESDVVDDNAKRVMEALEKMEHLSLRSRMKLSFQLMSKSYSTQLFLNASTEGQVEIVQMLLEGETLV